MRVYRSTAVLLAAAVISLACGGGGNTSTGGSSACTKTWKVGLVTDVGKLTDKSFNANAWQGAQNAQNDKALCVQAKYIESNQPTDYPKNIQTFVDQNYDMVVTVGFLLGPDTLAASKKEIALARKSGAIKFAIVDNGYDPVKEKPPANIVGLVFQEDQAGYEAGALAGLMTKTNVIGGVYGLNIPPVFRYRAGFEAGAKAVNPQVKVLGVYQPESGPKDFNDPDFGKAQATAMFGQGADIVFGAGGNTGNGALLAAVQAKKTCIGVDVDQYISYPDADPCLLTSAEKRIDNAVLTAITDMVQNKWPTGNLLSFNAANNGVTIAPYHDYASKVPADVDAKVKKIQADLASGALKTGVT